MKKYTGSTIALILGFFYFADGLTNLTAGLIAGPIIILGALAYRSGKKRMLGEVNNSALRKVLEVIAICLIAALILLQNNLKELIQTDPVPNLFIPLWAVIAYIFIASRKSHDIEIESDSNKSA